MSVLFLLAVSCNRDLAPDPGQPAVGAPLFPVRVRVPPKLTSVEVTAGQAQSVRLACVTCHSSRGSQPAPESPADLREFHAGLSFRHGTLRCVSCHSPSAPSERFRLADGREIQTVEAIALCSQCHGPQRRSYEHGAHGGMRGYWDLSRGARERNMCVDCHDPHVPKFVGGKPVHLPKDRFFGGEHD